MWVNSWFDVKKLHLKVRKNMDKSAQKNETQKVSKSMSISRIAKMATSVVTKRKKDGQIKKDRNEA